MPPSPTAQASVAEMMETPFRLLSVGVLLSRVQLPPCRRQISPPSPTAQPVWLSRRATAFIVWALGGLIVLHVVPLYCISAPFAPTAHAALAPKAATAWSGAGAVATACQALLPVPPLHR